ncbi:MAG: flagellar assembly protein FliH [Proteobacteria bacterium]|nr:flagellar assembly protein FliH [Pseudomonadota bacterium]HQR05014.1 flagellar assembly protein FliH [Rhodocyclaceae bacterium]
MSREKQTAWERWEIGALDEERSTKTPLTKIPLPPQLPTAEEIGRIRQEAYAAGYREGLEAGNTDGFKAGQQEAEAMGREAAGRFLELSARLDQALDALNETVGDELVALALEIARHVIRQSIAVHPETIRTVVKEALAQLPQQHAGIFLHPEDAALLRACLDDQITHAGHRIHEAPQLERGDVVVEAGGTHIDATLGQRWQRIVQALDSSIPWIAPSPSTPSSES